MSSKTPENPAPQQPASAAAEISAATTRPRRPDPSRFIDLALGRMYRWIPGFERIYARHLHPARLNVERVRVRLSSWEPSSHRIRIAHLSDIHLGPIVGRETVRSIFELVAARRPDIVCLTGDFVNHSAREIERYEGLLEILRPELGMFAVLGNHDHYAGRGATIARYLEERGVQVLVNESRHIETPAGPLQIAGLDDLHFGEPDVPKTMSGLDPKLPRVMLSHHPDAFPAARREGFDLVLSGHTHGGQICLPWIGPILKHSRHGYHGGHFEEEGSHLFVSRGLGAVVLPIRFRCAAHLGWIECLPAPAPRLRQPRRERPSRATTPAAES